MCYLSKNNMLFCWILLTNITGIICGLAAPFFIFLQSGLFYFESKDVNKILRQSGAGRLIVVRIFAKTLNRKSKEMLIRF